jgi:hypothetical protein
VAIAGWKDVRRDHHHGLDIHCTGPGNQRFLLLLYNSILLLMELFDLVMVRKNRPRWSCRHLKLGAEEQASRATSCALSFVLFGRILIGDVPNEKIFSYLFSIER